MSFKIEGKNNHFTQMKADAVGLLVPRTYLNDPCVSEFMSMDGNPYLSTFAQAVKKRRVHILADTNPRSRFQLRHFVCAVKLENLGVEQVIFELLTVVGNCQIQNIATITVPFATFASCGRQTSEQIAQKIVTGAKMYATRAPASNLTLYVASPVLGNAELINRFAKG